jgi:hypothetical protein
MKKVMKKGKRGNRKERLVVYEEMKSLNENSTSSYWGFQNPKSIDEVVFKRLINGISTRKYEKAALEVPATFGINNALSEKAVIQCCQWHKRENILKYLDKKHQSNFRRKLQSDYEQPTYEVAKKKLNLIKRELAILNQSAVRSSVSVSRLPTVSKISCVRWGFTPIGWVTEKTVMRGKDGLGRLCKKSSQS